MVQLTYLSVALLATAMNLFTAVHALPQGDGSPDAVPADAGAANSTLTEDGKSETGVADRLFPNVGAVVNSYLFSGSTLEDVYKLVPGVCSPLRGSTAEVTWKKVPSSVGE
jgi:hypothetical protein